jgi:hypothetical protein
MTTYQRAKSLGFVSMALLIALALGFVFIFGQTSHSFAQAVKACSDTIDNDGDGLVDFPTDPGCNSANANSEVDIDFCHFPQGNETNYQIFLNRPESAWNSHQNHIGDFIIDTPEELTLCEALVNNTGTITVTKNVTGTATPTTWSFGFTGNLSGLTTLTNLMPVFGPATSTAGTYTIAENLTLAGGWSFVDAQCTGDDNSSINANSVTIDLDAGENVSCTFTNNFIAPSNPAHLTLVKNVVNDDFGSSSTSAWTLSASGPTPISGVTGNAAVTNAAVNAGAYVLAESAGPSGYIASQYSCVKNGGQAALGNSITLADGDTATCTITNDDAEPGTLIVRKTLLNDSGTGQSGTTSFSFQINGGTVTPFEADGENQVPVLAGGTYSVTEVGDPIPGYATSYDNCSNLTIASGATSTCTITNNDVPRNKGTITVNKIVALGGNLSKFFDFTASWDGDGFSLQDGDSEGPIEVSIGTYNVSETPVAGWTQSATCENQNDTTFATSSIIIADGDAVSCTFTNTELPECSNGLNDDGDQFTDFAGGDPGCTDADDDSEDAFGHITIDKEVNGENASVFTQFTFDPSWSQDNIVMSADNAAVTSPELTTGTYSIVETEPNAQWTLSSVKCYDGDVLLDTGVTVNLASSSVAVDLAEGQNVSCVFKNTYRPSTGSGDTEHIIVRKEVTQGGDLDFDFEFDPSWGDNFFLADSQENDSGDLDENATYTVSEIIPSSGWTQQSVLCTGVVPGDGDDSDTIINDIDSDDITLQNGETVTCVFTNAQDPGRFVLDVTTSGDGHGLADGNGISCDTDTEEDDCSEVYVAGTVVTLTATPDEGSNFEGSWSGACTGNNPVCQITMNGNQQINAHFALNSNGGGSNGGGSGGGSHRRGGGNTGDGEVLGAATTTDQTSIIPLGAPNTGFGGMSGATTEGVSTLGSLFSLFGGLALFAGKKEF